MSTEKNTPNTDPEVAIEHALSNTELFFERHGKKLLIGLLVVVVAVSGYFAYTGLYAAPRQEKAAAAMFDAQMAFAQDSFAVALAGNGVTMGFDEIIAEFSGTPQANLAQHYAGICCLHTGDFQRALGYFETFDNQKGAVGEVITAQNIGLMGDCYVELGQAEKGVEQYLKAAGVSNNPATAPLFLQKAALVNLSLGKAAAALEQFQQIKSDYPYSIVARDIDKYIAWAQQQ